MVSLHNIDDCTMHTNTPLRAKSLETLQDAGSYSYVVWMLVYYNHHMYVTTTVYALLVRNCTVAYIKIVYPLLEERIYSSALTCTCSYVL